MTTETVRQESIDRFYWANGPCCAGCDHWRSHTGLGGECRKSAPMSGSDRAAMLGIHSCSMPIGAGHALTLRDHHCGEFRDNFDWSSLPLGYQRRIGVPAPSKP